MFTRKVSDQQENVVVHSPNCRTIRLEAGPVKFIPRDILFEYAPDFLQNFLDFELKNNFLYPVIHTNYWISGMNEFIVFKHPQQGPPIDKSRNNKTTK